MDKDRVIKNQAKVIKELWSELQALKRVLIDHHPFTWREINMNKTCESYTNFVSCENKIKLNEESDI